MPTPGSINKKELLHDVQKFNRRIKLKSHFGTTLQKGDLYFKSNSTWEPNNVHHTVKTFIEDFNQKVRHSLENELKDVKTNRKNLSKKESRALEDLKNREDIVICNADKGGAVVISDVKEYIKEANRQLSDRNFYKKVPHNPTSENAALVNNAIDNLKNQGCSKKRWLRS